MICDTQAHCRVFFLSLGNPWLVLYDGTPSCVLCTLALRVPGTAGADAASDRGDVGSGVQGQCRVPCFMFVHTMIRILLSPSPLVLCPIVLRVSDTAGADVASDRGRVACDAQDHCLVSCLVQIMIIYFAVAKYCWVQCTFVLRFSDTAGAEVAFDRGRVACEHMTLTTF